MKRKKHNIKKWNNINNRIFIRNANPLWNLLLFPNVIGETITKVEKDVTITDEGIADAVEKVYDSVVVVNTYIEGKAYSSGTGFVYKTENKKLIF